ncbi:MAG: alpha/beta hydrolase-fold protein, partial [Bacteroidota bacterium]
MMKLRLLLFLLALTGQLFAQLTLKVTSVPANTPLNSDIYVAGSFQAWNPADPNYILTNNGDGTYQITVNPPVGLVEFKFTRGGSWTTVEGNANGGQQPNHTYNYNGTPATAEVAILTWEDLAGNTGNSTAAANVHILDEDFFMPQLNRNRRIWIYLPPDYQSSTKHYPVLYMHDGQNVFDETTSFSGEWEVDESLNQLFNEGDYGCIVVAVDNGGALRADELSPWVNTQYNEGGEGDEYLDFILETLKPHVDANYRTLPGRDFTALMGSSLGGLSSHYGLIQYQDVVSKAGIFSPAYWFNSPQIFDHTDDTPKTQPLKAYIIVGQIEGGSANPANQVNQMHDLMLENGFTDDQEVEKIIHADGAHSEWYWAREFPAAYKWLFGGLNLSAANEAAANQVKVYPNPADSVLF